MTSKPEIAAQAWRDLEAGLRAEGISRALALKAVFRVKAWLQHTEPAPEPSPRPAASASALLGLAERITALAQDDETGQIRNIRSALSD